MKLKDEYVMYDARENEVVVVPIGEEAKKFKGLFRANEAASFILICLKEETTKEEILEKMKAVYNAEEEVLAKDIDEVLEKLIKIGAVIE